jgi:hypothetical protein
MSHCDHACHVYTGDRCCERCATDHPAAYPGVLIPMAMSLALAAVSLPIGFPYWALVVEAFVIGTSQAVAEARDDGWLA